jgi:hypothetical protein
VTRSRCLLVALAILALVTVTAAAWQYTSYVRDFTLIP